MELKNGTWVLVCDAGKYLLLVNHGGEDMLDLRVVEHGEAKHPASHQQGSDKPGRFIAGLDRRGSADETDWHDLGKKRFAIELAKNLNDYALNCRFSDIVIFADKSTLGVLRQNVSTHVSERIRAEIGADYAHRTIASIERAISSAE